MAKEPTTAFPDEPNQKVPEKITQGFGTVSAEKSAELAAIAVSAAAKAEVESAYIMAIRTPRKESDARAAIVATCKHHSFAKKARYRKPAGKKFNQQTNQWEDVYAIGPSIRFAEEAIRQWGNILVQQTMIYDDAQIRIVKVAVRDLQTNSLYSSEITIEKKIERRNNTDRIVLGERTNSRGQKVYIVQATEDEIVQKQAALVSKQIRNNGLRLIPDHIVEDAMEQVTDTLQKKITEDPDAARKKLVDGFFEIGVKASDLETYLRKPLPQANAQELVELSEILTSIKDGQASWSEYIRTEVREEEADRQTQKGDIKDIQEKLAEQNGGTAAPGVTAEQLTAPEPPRFIHAPPKQEVPAHDHPVVETKKDAPEYAAVPVSDSMWTDFRLWAFEEAPAILDAIKREEGLGELRKIKDSKSRKKVMDIFKARYEATTGKKA